MLDADFCIEALNEAAYRFGPPDIMNSDQGSQFTSFAWTGCLRRCGARISMGGKGRYLDNVFIERLWRTLKYECVYLHAWGWGPSMHRYPEIDSLLQSPPPAQGPWRPTTGSAPLSANRSHAT